MLPTPFLGMFQSKRFCPSTCQFRGYRCQRSCFYDFEPLFQVWLLFQIPHPIIWQKYLSFSNAEFNSASVDTNLNKIEATTRKLGYPFLFALSRFLANLIKFTFSVFPNPSGRVGKFFLDPGDGEKLAGTLKKNQVDISTGTLFRAKTKETLFHYIIGIVGLSWYCCLQK